MPCGSCGGQGPGTIESPRIVEKPLTAAEIRARMPRRPEQRVVQTEEDIQAPRRTR